MWPRKPWPAPPVRDERWIAKRLIAALESRRRGPYGLAGLVTVPDWDFACKFIGEQIGAEVIFLAGRGNVSVLLGVTAPLGEVSAVVQAFEEVRPESVTVTVWPTIIIEEEAA